MENITALYIEDNQQHMNLVNYMLQDRGNASLLTAREGRAGLDMARRERPDVIFLDLGLPDLPGIEVLECLRSDEATKTIPVVVVTADKSYARSWTLREAGAQAYLTKPIDVVSLNRILDQVLTAPDFGAEGSSEAPVESTTRSD